MNRSRKRVVAIMARAYDSYQRGIVAVVRQRLADAGYGVICLMDGNYARNEHGHQNAFERIDADIDVQGLIMLTGLLGNDLPLSSLQQYVSRIAETDLPVVSLGAAISGVPSVALNAEPSLVKLMRHMTRDSSRRHFAFIQGYASGLDSVEREQIFRRELARRGIPINERLVFEGRFIGADAYAGLDARLNEGHRIDAVVAANDVMAGAAILALEKHGLSVPDDVIVSGFDDAVRSLDSQCAMTSIPQYIDRQALVATEMLLSGMGHGPSLAGNSLTLIDTELVIRRSSCPDGECRPVCLASGSDDSDAAESEPTSVSQWLKTRMLAQTPPPGCDVDDVIEAVLSALDGEDESWADMLKHALSHGGPLNQVGRWGQHVLAQLDALMLRIEDHQRPALRRLSSRLESSLQIARESDQFERDAQRLRHERLLLLLAACPNREAIWALLRESFASLGIPRAWVLLDDPCKSREIRRQLAFSLEEPSLIAAEEPWVGHGDVLPSRLDAELESGLLVMIPLQVGDGRSMGLLLVDPERSTRLELGSIAANLAQALARAVDASALQESHQALKRIAHSDSLTGLPNRVCFQRTLETRLARAQDEDRELCLLFLDLDGFKLVNDTLGHSAGDQLLRIIGGRIEQVLRSDDTLARLGGDEFTILIDSIGGKDSIRKVAETVIEAVASPCRLDKRLIDTSASIGIACYPRDGNTAEALLQNADTAMYHAKAGGKNRYSFYEHEFNREAIARLELLDDMRSGISSSEFRMHYQPRVDLDTGALVAFEALMRWRRGSDGAEIGPDRFIPIAEESGIVSVLDAFALDTVCAQAAHWARHGHPIPVSINLSMRCLQEDDIVARVSEAVRRHDLDASLLEIEITESAAMQDVEHSIRTVTALRALGIQIAIDDFGTGYSSLSYLQRLPVTSLKVDRAFFGSINDKGDADPADIAIVSAVVALGTALGFRIVAEGIENDAQCALASRLNCDEGQGWLFGRALSVDSATAHLRECRHVVHPRVANA